jgi:GntR family transcriptional regulator
VRQPRYLSIADDLRTRVRAHEYGAGGLLPSEADLSATYAVSRVTVRKALEVLRDEGVLAARQGVGWFVAADPLRQSLGRLATLESHLERQGRRSQRQILDFAFVAAADAVRAVLGVDEVLEVRRLNLADGAPFAVVTVWCPAELAADLSRADVERSPFVDLLADELGGARQTIAASAAGAEEAALLDLPTGAPVLRCERISYRPDGTPALFSRFVFPGHLTEFVVDLPHPERSIAPTGLRLLE